MSTIPEFTTAEKVAFLKKPEHYLYRNSRVTAKETHMSWVFLTDGYVYKMKKPVKLDMCDHSSLSARYQNSLEEVRINKPLAPEIYLGVVPLTATENGLLQLEGNGTPVEWLVKMGRIPDRNLLDYAIIQKSISEKGLRNAAELLTSFYITAQPAFISGVQYLQKLETDINNNYDQLTAAHFALPHILVKELCAGLLAFLASHPSHFTQRADAKRIIDAHGDLKPEHICLAPRPAIIDRLEFNPSLRVLDIAEELSFLAMECEVLGNKSVGKMFFDVYGKHAHDNIPPELILFYKIRRACIRAFLVARHIEEAQYKEDPKWLRKANAYLELAASYLQQLGTTYSQFNNRNK